MKPLILLLIAALVSGCQFDAAPKRAATVIDTPRAGEVYLVRGLLGIFSTGMDQLEDELARRGVRAIALQHTSGHFAAQAIIRRHSADYGPIILVGHSLGADEVVAMAQRLHRANIPIALLVTLDAVNADPVPANVQHAINFYRSQGVLDLLPAFRGIPLKARPGSPAIIENLDLNNYAQLRDPGTNHFSIDTSQRVQNAIITEILKVCPPEYGPQAIHAAHTLNPEGP